MEKRIQGKKNEEEKKEKYYKQMRIGKLYGYISYLYRVISVSNFCESL